MNPSPGPSPKRRGGKGNSPKPFPRREGTAATAAGLGFLLLVGCSPRDPLTKTPVYHVGVPTNRSTVNSTDPFNQPFYAQPGVNGGRGMTVKSKASGRGFEPNDPLAGAVYDALAADGGFPTKYLSVRAGNGVVILAGTVDDARQKARAETLARRTPGVKKLVTQLKVAP